MENEKMKRNHKQDIKITKLCGRVDALKESFEKFVNNEFTHLREDVGSLRNAIFFGFIIVIAASVIAQIVLKFF